MPREDPGKIKGVAFREFIVWYEGQFGGARVRAAIDGLSPDDRGAFDPDRPVFGVLASEWYPAARVHALVDGLTADRTPAELNRMAADAADAIMRRTLRGVYRTLFSLIATPERYGRHVQKLWDTHYDSGVVTVEDAGPNAYRNVTRGWRGHHPFICRMNRLAAKPIYEAMGFENVQVDLLACVSQGQAMCSGTARWQK